MSKSLTDRTLSGINWNFIKTYSKSVINIVVGIVLARILPPEDFGLLGMVVVFTGLADLFATMGMGASIIKFKDLTYNHICVGTTFTVLLGFLVFGIFWFLSDFISIFYNEPRLTDIIQVLSIIFILKGITTVSYGLIVKEIDFKTILKIELSGFLFGYSLISITLALLGFGVWSLVFGRLATAIFTSIFTLIKKPPKLRPMFKKKEFLDLFSFGAGVSLSKFINYTANNIDYLIIGKFLSPFLLGLYQKSYNLMTQPIMQISSGIYNVLFPAFAEVQDDVQKLKTGYLRTLQTVVFLLFPILVAMIVCGKYIILGLFGPNWEGAVDVFKILVFAGFFRSTLSYSGAIAHATGKVYNEVGQQLIYVSVLVVGIFYGVQYGIEGVGAAVVLALFVLFLLQSNLAIKITEISWSEFLKVFIPGAANGMIALITNIISIFLIEISIDSAPMPVLLAILIMINVIVFILCILFLPKSLKSDSIDWIITKYSRYIPSKFISVYGRFN
jgi:O-antigen/teichoic acid export membrane protein